MWVSKFNTSLSVGNKFLGTEIKCGDLSLSGGAGDHFEDGGNNHDGCVYDLEVVVPVARVDVATSSAACFWGYQIGGVYLRVMPR